MAAISFAMEREDMATTATAGFGITGPRNRVHYGKRAWIRVAIGPLPPGAAHIETQYHSVPVTYPSKSVRPRSMLRRRCYGRC